MNPPYSLEQAKYLYSVYRRLIGAQFDSSNIAIEDVVIIPFDQASRQRFILYYMVMAADAQEVVLQEYKGFLFDILLIAHNALGEIVYKDLASYLGPNGVSEDTETYKTGSETTNLFFTDSIS